MSGIQQFIVACLVIALLAATIAVIVRRGLGGRVSLSLASIFDVQIEIDAADADAAKSAAEAAAKARGGEPTEDVGREIDGLRNVRLARVLWVDDNPDGNLYETVALEELGLFITKATSTEAATAYLGSTLTFSMIISDIARDGDPNAGSELLASVAEEGGNTPVIFYTFGNESRHRELLDAGAVAVVQTPGDLVEAVLAHRPA
ncbi:hypothetical protein ACN3XK_24045 [Actinomadura welshii]